MQAALDEKRAALQAEAGAVAPEMVLVLETNGPVTELVEAVRATPGLAWLAEEDLLDVAPDEDFFVTKDPGKALTARLYMVMTNHAALEQLLSLWADWRSNKRLPKALNAWRAVFAKLRDVRRWGSADRLAETGIIEDWEDRKTFGASQVSVEIELWFRDAEQRRDASDRVSGLVRAAGGQVLQTATVTEIAYHAMLARLPIDSVEQLVSGNGVALVKADDVRFFRPVPQARIVPPVAPPAEDARDSTPATALGEPVVALLDGLPVENHSELRGRLVVDDPDGWAATYPVDQRFHATAMASLILHGDLAAPGAPSDRRLYVRPILRPDSWNRESAPENQLWVDLVHQAIRRFAVGEADAPPAAPGVRIVNLSVGDSFQPFVDVGVSPLARLLDWLAWEHNLLFIVSAGNHPAALEIERGGGSGPEFEDAVLRALQQWHRHRRLLSPAESVNSVTVGAAHHDESGPVAPRYAEERLLLTTAGLPSPFSALGRGFRKAVKPDVLAPGGRQLYTAPAEFEGPAVPFKPVTARPLEPPGQKVAAPIRRGTLYQSGTSNAAALTTRTAEALLRVVRQVAGASPDLAAIPEVVLLKALLVHTAEWPAAAVEVLERALKTEKNKNGFWDYLSAFIGYGLIHSDRAVACTADRATLLGGGAVRENETHLHRVPLPPGLNAFTGRRRLTVTLAWLSPVNPNHRKYRSASLSFEPPIGDRSPLRVDGLDVDLRAVRRGTVQHAVLERSAGAINLGPDDQLEIPVTCVFESNQGKGYVVPYGLAVSLEVAPGLGVSIYDEVRDRVRPRVPVRA